MRLIFTILFLSGYNANATVYYVSNSGNNASAGTSTGTPWQTIAKVNSTSFNPGDQILFKAGDSWNETLIVPSSGAIGSVITFGSYGTGIKPVITGFQTQSGFTNVGNIWTATASNSVASLNTVLINGSLRAKARTPNTGWSTFSSFSGSTQITTALSGTPDYTGSELRVRTTHWIIDHTKITSQSSGVLNFSPALTYTPNGGNGYFIQNTISDLDIENEWVYDSTTKVLKIYSTTSPNVQISTIDTLVKSNNKNYITFDGLSFTGSNKNAVVIDTSRGFVFQNCTFNNNGGFAIFGRHSALTTIQNDSILNSLSNAIYLADWSDTSHCDSAFIYRNYIKNTGIFQGMGVGGNSTNMAIFSLGTGSVIKENVIDSTGFNGIYFYGRNTLIKNNYISNFDFLKDDGGAINTIISTLPADFSDGTIIRGNVLMNGIGATAGTAAPAPAAGIFLDTNTRNILVDSNTIYNCFYSGINLYQSGTITIKNNTVANTTGVAYAMTGSNSYMSGLDVKHNIFVSLSSGQYILYRLNGTTYSTSDSNYLSRPLLETNSFNHNGTTYGLSGWQTATSQEGHSTGTPSNIASTTPVFYYNPTGADSTINLSDSYVDIKGTRYANSVVLHPFTSLLLFIATPHIITSSTGLINFAYAL